MGATAVGLLVGLIAVALVFDFLNGLHDAANSIATIVSTRVLPPKAAVFWAAFFNFIAFLFFGLHVAQTIGTGIIDPSVISPRVIFAALMGAISWNLITWWAGIPSSSSHALIGGLLGANCQSRQHCHHLEGRPDDDGCDLPFAAVWLSAAPCPSE
jgi:inorganic phosphate transporter, PiT family